MSRLPRTRTNPKAETRSTIHPKNVNSGIAKRTMPVPVPRKLHGDISTCHVPAPRRHRRFHTSFSSSIRRNPPAIPPSLLRFVSELEPGFQNATNAHPHKKKDNVGPGRVKVLLRVCPQQVLKNDVVQKSKQSPQQQESILRVEGNRKHVTIFDSESGLQSAQIKVGVSAPKLYAFDAVFPEESSQIEVCSTSLTDVIQAVVQGADGAVFCYGHSGLGKTYTLIGSDANEYEVGLIPCGISWLYRAIDEMKEKTKGRFSVRVSAIEIQGRTEKLKDLLKEFSKDGGPTDDLCVREDPLFGTQLQNQSELRASSAEKAAYLLDAALSTRSSSGSRSTEEARRHSHMVYTLHVYQYRLDKTGQTGVSGGRSRLHFIDLGSCERTLVKTPNSLTLSLNSLGHVIMAIINNSKHVPFKESKLTMVLQELLGNFNCRTVMLAHVAKASTHYADTMSTVQMASRIHRVLMKKKSKSSSTTSVRGIGPNCHLSRSVKSHKRGTDEESVGTSSGVGETSGSEVSCDTVIYVRPNGVPFSDRELTDNEGPPPSVPVRSPPQVAKSLSKINESNGIIENKPRNNENVKEKSRGKIPVSRFRETHKSSQSKRHNAKSNVQMVHSTSNTQLKLENHAKLVKNLCRNNDSHKTTRVSKPSSNPSSETSKQPCQTRSKNSSNPYENTSSLNRNFDNSKQTSSSSIKSQKRRSRIPPPPPPRLPTTRLRHNSSDPMPTQGDNLQSDYRTEHHPTYETLHSSHASENLDEPISNNEYDNDDGNHLENVPTSENDWQLENSLDDHNVNFEPEFELPEDIVPAHQMVEDYIDRERSYRNEDSQDSISRFRSQKSVQNISYNQIILSDPSISNTDLSKCLQDFEDVLSSVEAREKQQSVKTTIPASFNDMRPESMFVNVNDEEWNSDEDEDTYTSDCDVSEGDDVIDVNFYCLSFTTKNPLIPLSKRSFVKEVTKRKRMSKEERGSDETSTGDDTESNPIQKWAEKVNRTFPPEKCVSDNTDQNFERSSSSLRRSVTFDANSGTPIELLPDCNNDDDIKNEDIVKSYSTLNRNSTEESAIDATSTTSSPSQVLLYDSSSLEINYVKPKSFGEINPIKQCASNKPKNEFYKKAATKLPVPEDSSKLKQSSAMKASTVMAKNKQILVAGSSGTQGTQLSLVKRNGEAFGLELVITSENDVSTSGCAMPTEDKIKNNKRLVSSKKGNQNSAPFLSNDTAKQSPSKRSKWGGLKKFGSKKEKDEVKSKSPHRSNIINSKSPAKSKTTKKQENETIKSLKSSSSPSFVSKLLSPKLRRSQKSPNCTSTASADFRYRSPNVISQVRPDIVRTGNSFTSTEQLSNDIGENIGGTIKNSWIQSNEVLPIDNSRSVPASRRDKQDHSHQTPSTRTRFGFTRKAKS
ncbi:uncharacterized protein LOC120336762 [Styela clava]